jgi:hypothetical protein
MLLLGPRSTNDRPEEFEAGQHEEAPEEVEPSATITAANLFKQPVNPLRPY